MPIDWRIEPLRRDHDRDHFNCGEVELNDYLARYARQNQDAGIARTFVAVEESMLHRVLAYYSLAVGSIAKTGLPPSASKRLPKFPLPVVRLARLAVALDVQRNGLGEDMLLDALQRCLRVEADVGIAAVLVDAKSPRAKSFYLHYEFESLPEQPSVRWLPMPAIRRLFAELP